jgi:hypothetical protein
MAHDPKRRLWRRTSNKEKGGFYVAIFAAIGVV